MTCHRGEATLGACSAWRKSNGEAQAKVDADDATHTRLPWSGTALGTSTFGFLTGRSDPKIVGLLGAHNAGKTTLLGAWYQLTGRSGRIGDQLFAGSYSLEGWEAVAYGLRWEGDAPRFPPHTPAGVGRAPGLLHLALRTPGGRLDDVLFADAPGEWFHRWAVQRDAPDAAGARWLADRSSIFIVVADCESLAGEERGTARNNLVQLLRRVADERGTRPVALLWTKSDVAISEGIRKAVHDAAVLVMPDIVEFSVSIMSHRQGDRVVEATEGMNQVLKWAVAPLDRGIASVESPIAAEDPFFAFGAGR